MAAIAGVSLTTPRAFISAKATDSPKLAVVKSPWLNYPWKTTATQFGSGRVSIRPVASAPETITEKVAESIKSAEQTCSDDPASGECVAAWDEVEELSAAASHARDKNKATDKLEEYCKDNMDADECRTYED